MKNIVKLGILVLLLTQGFIILSYDRSDDGVKILNEDDYNEEISNYEIENRRGCEMIKNPQKYNECLKFYQDNDPYEPGEIISLRRRIK